MKKKRLFITLEGSDGSGKSTVCRKISEKLKSEGYNDIGNYFKSYFKRKKG